MTLKDVMAQERFVIVGNTLDPEKYACRIKNAMLEAGYTVYAVGKELESINEVSGDIDVIDLCINPVKGLALMKECEKSCKSVVIQPGAGSDELKAWLSEKGIDWSDDCLLIGLDRFPRRK